MENLLPGEFRLRKNEYVTETSPFDFCGHYMTPEGKVVFIGLNLKQNTDKHINGIFSFKPFKGKHRLDSKDEDGMNWNNW